MDDYKVKIPSPNAENFDQWISMIEAFARMHDIEEFVFKDQIPQDPTKKTKYWQLSTLIQGSVNQQYQHLVQKRGEAKEWYLVSILIKRLKDEIRPHKLND